MKMMKYQRYLPHIKITREMVRAFANEDFHELHLLIGWKPWEQSPLRCQMMDLSGRNPEDLSTQLWLKAMALREMFLELAAREGLVCRDDKVRALKKECEQYNAEIEKENEVKAARRPLRRRA